MVQISPSGNSTLLQGISWRVERSLDPLWTMSTHNEYGDLIITPMGENGELILQQLSQKVVLMALIAERRNTFFQLTSLSLKTLYPPKEQMF